MLRPLCPPGRPSGVWPQAGLVVMRGRRKWVVTKGPKGLEPAVLQFLVSELLTGLRIMDFVLVLLHQCGPEYLFVGLQHGRVERNKQYFQLQSAEPCRLFELHNGCNDLCPYTQSRASGFQRQLRLQTRTFLAITPRLLWFIARLLCRN